MEQVERRFAAPGSSPIDLVGNGNGGGGGGGGNGGDHGVKTTSKLAQAYNWASTEESEQKVLEEAKKRITNSKRGK